MKTLAKPLSKRIKHEFSRYQPTRRLLIGIGQASHNITSRMTIWSAGYRVRHITPLEDEKALSTGSEFIGEFFILFVSGGTVVWEYNRTQEKNRVAEQKQREKAAAERQALQAKLHALDVRVKALEQVSQKNNASILSIGQEKYVPPDEREIVPIDDPSAGGSDEDGDEGNTRVDADRTRTRPTENARRWWWPW